MTATYKNREFKLTRQDVSHLPRVCEQMAKVGIVAQHLAIGKRGASYAVYEYKSGKLTWQKI